jgi:hypothetical protein
LVGQERDQAPPSKASTNKTTSPNEALAADAGSPTAVDAAAALAAARMSAAPDVDRAARVGGFHKVLRLLGELVTPQMPYGPLTREEKTQIGQDDKHVSVRTKDERGAQRSALSVEAGLENLTVETDNVMTPGGMPDDSNRRSRHPSGHHPLQDGQSVDVSYDAPRGVEIDADLSGSMTLDAGREVKRGGIKLNSQSGMTVDGGEVTPHALAEAKYERGPIHATGAAELSEGTVGLRAWEEVKRGGWRVNAGGGVDDGGPSVGGEVAYRGKRAAIDAKVWESPLGLHGELEAQIGPVRVVFVMQNLTLVHGAVYWARHKNLSLALSVALEAAAATANPVGFAAERVGSVVAHHLLQHHRDHHAPNPVRPPAPLTEAQAAPTPSTPIAVLTMDDYASLKSAGAISAEGDHDLGSLLASVPLDESQTNAILEAYGALGPPGR